MKVKIALIALIISSSLICFGWQSDLDTIIINKEEIKETKIECK